MEFKKLVALVGDEPVFESSLLLAGDVDTADVRRQLSRWTGAGRLYQLRRRVYALAPPFQKIKPHPFVVANHLARASYVSCQSALSYYDLIPEYTPVTVSVTTGRPAQRDTPLGRYEFRHVQPGFLQGYRRVEVAPGQWAFVAAPEKALLDLIYLQPGGDAPEYLRELRLQEWGRFDRHAAQAYAEQAGSPKLRRAVERAAELARTEEYEVL
jgi:predicted transcriptional regulator of viral defense system